MNTLRHFTLVITLFLALLLSPYALAAPGDLDALNLNIAGSNVLASAVQPDGKTIIAGIFTSVLGQPRNRIARLNADGTLDAGFNPNANGTVNSIVVQADGQILLGGGFTTLQPNGAASATTRNYIARVNADGTLDTGFNPNANNWINGVAVQADGQILLGGEFTTVGGTTRNRIARLAANGTLDAGFNPNANSIIYSVALQADGQILLGGQFTTVGGTARNRIARVAANGTLDAGFNPNANDWVNNVAVQADGKILLGGLFTTVGGTARNNIARVNANGTLDAGFNPTANSRVYNVAVQADGKILLCGLFTSVGGTARNYIARVDAAGALDAGFNPNANNSVTSVAVQGDGQILLGGVFTTVGGTARNLFARLLNDPATQTLSAVDATQVTWSRSGSAPEVTQTTFELSTNGGSSYTPLGGAASRVGTTANWQISGLNLPASGQLRARGRSAGGYNNGSSGLVEQVTSFSGLLPAPTVTSISPPSGTKLGGTSVTITGTNLTGATAVTIGGAAAASVAVVNDTTLTATTPAHAAGTASVFVTTPAGTSAPNMLFTYADPGDMDSLNPAGVGSGVWTSAAQPDGKTIIAGNFSSVLGQQRNNIARLNADGTLDAVFNPTTDGTVRCVTVQADGKILLGGFFTSVGGTARNRIARVNADGTLDAGFNPNANNSLYSIAVQADGKILLGGLFTSVGGTTRKGIARMNADGSLDTGFSPNVNSSVVHSVAVQADGRILLGGSFDSVGGTARSNIARVNADGTLDLGFDPTTNSYVTSVVVQADGKILLGGDFTTLQPNGVVSPTARSRVARVNADGTLDTGFDPKVSGGGYLRCVMVQTDGKILLGGNFTTLQPNGAASATTRNYIARVNADGTLDTGFDPNANFDVYSVAAQADGKILLGGFFTTLQPNGAASATPRSGFTRLHNDPATQSLTAVDTTQATWTRGGSSPEVSQVTLEQSTDSGATWTLLGSGTRLGVTSNWQFTGLGLPTSGQLRARGRTTNGNYNGGSGLVEAVVSFSGLITPAPTVTGISPSSGPTFGGASVTITGTGFTGATGVTIGGTAATSVVVVNGATITATTPAGSAGAASVLVTTPGGTNVANTLYTYVTPPTVTSISPNTGSTLGGTSVTITGTGFTGSPAVTFGGTAATSVVVVNATTITATTPAGSAGTASVLVTTPGGTNTANTFYTYFVPAPTVTAIFPPSGNIFGGTGVTITGASFTGATGVTIGGIAATNVSVVDDTTITATTPAHVAGAVSVLVTTPVGTNAANTLYTYVPPVAGDVDPLDLTLVGFMDATAVQPDGKTIIAGSFTSVLGVARNSIARLNADGTLDAGFNPDVGGTISSVAVQADGKVLLGGTFTTVGGTARNNIARLNANGTLDAGFDPNADSTIYSLAVQADGKILLGGAFTTLQPNGAVNPTTRNFIARLNANGTLDAGFDPDADSYVFSLAVQTDGQILLGGWFSIVGGTARTCIARVDADGVLDAGFDPDPNGFVYSVALQADGQILLGGDFTTVGGTMRNNIARVDAAGVLDAGFDPDADNQVHSLAVKADGQILLAGRFTSVGGTARNYIARVDANGSLDPLFDPDANNRVYCVAVQADGQILIGGLFTSVGGTARNRMARLVNDPAYQTLSAVDMTQATWMRGGSAPEITQVTFELSTNGGSSYTPLGGSVTRVDGTADWEVNGLSLPASGQLRARGRTSGGRHSGSTGLIEQVISFSGLLPIAPGKLDPLDANIGGIYVTATAVQPDGKTIIAGKFYNVLGVARNHIARLNADGTLDAGFNPDADYSVYSVAVQADGKILLGGDFTAVGGTVRNHIARLNADGTLDAGFNPNVNDRVYSVAVQPDGQILLGGSFTNVGGVARNYIARVAANGTLDAGFNPIPDELVESVAVQADGKILLGGFFTSVGGTTRNRIARVAANGTLDAGFNPDADSDVWSMAVQADGKVLLAGGFTTVGGVARNYIARVNADGTLDTGFDPNASHIVYSVAVQADGRILLGGYFTGMGGTTRNRIARVNADGTLDAGFNPNANGEVDSVAVQADGKILLGGYFTNVGGTARNLFARLTNDPATQSLTAVDTTQATWTRGGSSPEVSQVTLEQSTDSGATWALIGSGARVGMTSNWQFTGLGLPTSGQLRARGRTTNGYQNGGSGLIEQTVSYSGLLPPPAPTITSFTPTSGSTLGGTSVTITGTNLTGATEVTFNGDAATSFTVVNATTITAVTGAHAAGLAMVSVTTPGGTDAANTLFNYIEPGPGIAVRQVSPLTDGTGGIAFTSTLGSSSAPLTFTITNPGAADLTSLVVTKDGPGAADFSVSALSATSIPGGGTADTATFTVTFHPTSGGVKAAALHIASNMTGAKNPFDIALTGSARLAGKASQMMVFNPPLKLYLAEIPFTLSASTSSGLPVAYTLISGPATLLGNVLTLNAAGTVKVRATQAGNADFLAAMPVDRTITVAANPTTMTLTNLIQTYTGTPCPITVLGATGAVDVTYKVGLNYVSTPPINAGSYSVKAVAGAVTKTGSLIINKAPLFVQPDDQRKVTGQVNPALTFGYSGFLGSDNAANSVSKAPVIATTATATSAGGLYPITASLGTSANYMFVYLRGTMKVETFAALYEALLVDAGTQRPSAKLELTVAASSKTFTGKLTTPTEMAAVALPGTLTINPLTETATGTVTVTKGANTYIVTLTLPLTGDFTAEAKRNGVTMGTATNGRKLLTLTTGQTLSYIGTHSALLAPAAAGTGVPAGAGWAVATIDAKGLLKLTGKLADGTGLTASLAADVSSNPGYRLFVQPYLPARTGAFIAGAFTLKPHPDLTGRCIVAFEDAADLTWVKAPRTLDTSYRAGFGPLSTRFTLDPWLPPAAAKGVVPAITLTQRLGLTANQFMAQHSTFSSASFIDLPTTLGLNATTNVVSIIAPVTTPLNSTKWKVTLTPATGAFTGSFELNDDGKKRAVPFTGIMRQPPSTDPSGLIGDGNFQLPALTPVPNNEVLSGEIGFER